MFMRYAGIGIGHSYAAMEPEEDGDEEPADNLNGELTTQVDDFQDLFDDSIDCEGEDDGLECDDNADEHDAEQDRLDVDNANLGPEDREADWVDIGDEEGFREL